MIELKDICKTFRVARRNAGMGQAIKALFRPEIEEIRALDRVSFSIAEGEMVGYIGPNGAGKSSTIKIMSGILTPDSGECTINGLTPWKNRKAHTAGIGVVFGQRSQLWWDLPVIDSFELLKEIYRIDCDRYRRNVEELTDRLELGEILRTPTRTLSLGQRMRCEIAASLLHDPKVLFLDEPTIGLDALSKIAVREFIRELNREKRTTVILTTHDMQDIEALTERIILIGRGKILSDGPLVSLKQRYARFRTVTAEFVAGGQDWNELPPGLTVRSAENGHGIFVVDTEQLSVSAAIGWLSEQAEIADLSVSGASAEEMVVGLYEEFRI